MKIIATEWARTRLEVSKSEAFIEAAEPLDAEAWFGYSHGWTCRITRNRVVIGEAYEAVSPIEAFLAASAGLRAVA